VVGLDWIGLDWIGLDWTRVHILESLVLLDVNGDFGWFLTWW